MYIHAQKIAMKINTEEYISTYANLALIAGQDITKCNGAVSIVVFVKSIIVDNSYVSI